jgi:hypothetical protein
MREGWYLMSVQDLEIELARLRGEDRPPSKAAALSMEDALAFRNAGNVPDEHGRTLRLVLDPDSASSLDERRLKYEPDFMAAPNWRREGSRPVNVVPLRAPATQSDPGRFWWDDPDMAALEAEWQETGAVANVRVPAELRSFVYKTVVALRKTDSDVSVQTICDSIARWLNPEQVALIREALANANPPKG